MLFKQKMNLINLVILSMAMFFLSSCAGTANPIELSIHSASNANENSPLSVDFVAVYDQDVLDSISSISASKWFQVKNQLKRDYPNGFQVTSWEVVPGIDLPMQVLDYKRKLLTTFVFVNYFSESEHRVRLTPKDKVTINLLDKKFTISNGDNQTGEKSEQEISESDEPVDNAQVKPKPKSKIKIDKTAIVLKSAAFPGWGQYASSRVIPASAYAVAFCGSFGWGVYNIFDYNKNVDDYNDILVNYNKSSGSDKIKYRNQANEKMNTVNDSETMLYISFGVAGGVYLINLIDAAVFTPEYGVEKKIKIDPKIDFDPANPKIGMNINYNF